MLYLTMDCIEKVNKTFNEDTKHLAKIFDSPCICVETFNKDNSLDINKNSIGNFDYESYKLKYLSSLENNVLNNEDIIVKSINEIFRTNV